MRHVKTCTDDGKTRVLESNRQRPNTTFGWAEFRDLTDVIC